VKPKFDKNKKKIKILILYLGYTDKVKKPSHATVPLKVVYNEKGGSSAG